MDMFENLESMGIQELEELIKKATELIAKKRRSDKEFTFSFQATNDPRKGKPFVARLYWQDGKIQREFFDLHQEWGKKEVTISGTYIARPGDIIEKRWGGSWKNDYRAWFFITDDGREIQVADIDESAKKARVAEYLQGKISANELL